MTREEEIKQAALEMYSGAISGHLAMRVGFETGAKWADEHPSQELKQQIVDKTVEWLKNKTMSELCLSIDEKPLVNEFIEDFKQAMIEE